MTHQVTRMSGDVSHDSEEVRSRELCRCDFSQLHGTACLHLFALARDTAMHRPTDFVPFVSKIHQENWPLSCLPPICYTSAFLAGVRTKKREAWARSCASKDPTVGSVPYQVPSDLMANRLTLQTMKHSRFQCGVVARLNHLPYNLAGMLRHTCTL